MTSGITYALVGIFGLAVLFDYINGFHDTANAIATSVTTRALRPGIAIVLSAIANFLGALTGTEVAATIGSGIVSTPAGNHGQIIIAAALIGGISWNLLTWRLGLPSSSSHALIGGLLGASLAALGGTAVHVEALMSKVVVPLVGSPIEI
ncbi:MAG: inorganic phosphate transporter, partial [Chloroflexi bacterium]|nr:inorganic phosphate transporter [Chloroflexota bacterium]